MWRKHKKEKMNSNLIIACPKGRLETKVVKYLADRGLEMEKAFFNDEIRKLTFDTNFKNIKVIKLKPSDIRSYTILGAADIGFVGYDDILENSSENIVLLQKTSIGKCRISIASDRKEIDFSEKKVFKVATKFQNISEQYFRERNIQTETIKLNGSIELAVKYGVADFILDLVQSGQTLKDNQLYENVIINNDISTVIISSYYAYDVKKDFIKKLLIKGL
jgi:ATP phosphoribosyltransferase